MKKSNPSRESDGPIKLIFGLYQCLHHLSLLTGGSGAGRRPVFSQKVEELDRFFIPAMTSWNPLFKKKCHQTNELWRKQQIDNLVEHYEYCIEALKGSIFASRLTSSERLKYLNQARKWAQQSYRRKFKASIFGKIDQIIQNLYAPKQPSSNPRCEANLKKGAATGSGSSSLSGKKQVTRPGATSNPSRKRVHSSGTTSDLASSTVKVSEPVPSKCSAKKTRVSPTGVASTPSRKRSRSSSGPSPSRSSPTQTQTQKRSKSFTKTADEHNSSISNQTNAYTPLDSPTITRFPKLKPTQRGQGMHDVWNIPKVVKDILILGDSNLGRASKVKRDDAQVVSYPGINLLKMFRLLENFKFGRNSSNPGRMPKHVVFSVGLNDRGCKPSTNEVSLNKLISRARQEFPASKISIYQQPFDHRLDKDEISSLKALNSAVETKCEAQGHNCIPALPRTKFRVNSSDRIHWTEECADATIEHIFSTLN